MRSVFAVAVAAFAALVAGPLAVADQAGACPLLSARLSTSPKARVVAGGKVTVNVKISKGYRKTALGQGAVAIHVPPGLCVLSTRPRGAQIVAETGEVTWPNVNFNKAGGSFKIRARIQSDYSGLTANFNAQANIPAQDCSSAATPVQVCIMCHVSCVMYVCM